MSNKLPIDKSTGHYYWLDLMRFLAAFAVLVCHYRGAIFNDFMHLDVDQQTTGIFVFFSATRLGHEAVVIFFVLSGFLVGGRLIDRLRKNTFNPTAYAIDRTVRIMLPLISALLLVFVVNLFRDTPESITAIDYIGNLFSLQGVYVRSVTEPLWSLSYEVWFYILAGSVAVIVTSTQRKKSTIAMLISFAAILVFSRLYPSYLLIWFMGAITYIAIEVKRNRALLYFSFVMMIISLIAMQATSGSQHPTPWLKYLPTDNRTAIEIWFSIFTCIFIKQIILFEPRFKISRFIEKSGTKLAAFSYTLYLTHIPILRFMQQLGLPSRADRVDLSSVSIFLMSITIALLSAYCIYWGFEKRTAVVKLYIKRRICKHKIC